MKHIPSSTTAEIDVLAFEDALKPSPGVSYDRNVWLYVPDFYSEYRYILGTRGQRPLICIGVNPSTARPDALDRTLQSVQRVALRNGYDSFIMFNVYAQRATVPGDMEKQLNPALHRENLNAFRWVLERSGAAPAVWAAWGNVIEVRDYLPRCVLDMVEVGKSFGAVWYTAGKKSKSGNPHHPLYLPSDSTLDPFNVEEYCQKLMERIK